MVSLRKVEEFRGTIVAVEGNDAILSDLVGQCYLVAQEGVGNHQSGPRAEE